jgi:di/tricarboxylate transporter
MMSPQTTFTIILLIATLLVMASQRLRTDLVAVLVLLSLILSGVLTAAEAFSAFGQPVIIIVACVFVLGAALYETGVATIIANQILRYSSRGEVIILLVIMLIAGLLTSVLGGMIVVALLMPAVLRISRRTQSAPSRLLLPLATMATVGSQLTLIGTPSNVVVSDILAAAGYEPLGLFSLTPYALASVGIVMAWYLLPGRRLLRQEFQREPEPPSLDEVQQTYKLDKLLYRLRVRASSDLIATELGASDLSTTFGLNLIAVRPSKGKLSSAGSEWVLEQDDLLIITGEYGRVLQAAARHDLEIKGNVQLREFSRAEQEILQLAEVIVPIRSPLVGRSLADIDFRTRYGLNILAVQRQGKAIRKNLAELVLTPGDTLLVEGPYDRVREVGRDLSLVFMTDLGPQPGDLVTGKAGITLVILGLMLISVVTGWLMLATASLLAVVALVLTGCISLERAYQSIDLRLIVLIGGMLPLAAALERTGAAALIAELMLGVSQQVGVLGSLVLVYMITALITQVIANSVVAALMMPIAINLAVAQGVVPEPFAIAMAFAVMAAFVTPFTDGDNLLVREPGQYTMRDFVVNGLPMFTLQTVVIITMLTMVYGLV